MQVGYTTPRSNEDEKALKKVAIVFASREIAQAVVEPLPQDGFAVIVNHRSSALEAENVVSKIRAEGGEAIAIKADVSDVGQVEQFFAHPLVHASRLTGSFCKGRPWVR